MAHDRAAILRHVEKLLEEIGPDEFSSLKLLKLEKMLRERDLGKELPGKTLLREVIHSFRVARWPATAPRKLNDRFRG